MVDVLGYPELAAHDLVEISVVHSRESSKKSVAAWLLPSKRVVFGALEGRGCSIVIVPGPLADTPITCWPDSACIARDPSNGPTMFARRLSIPTVRLTLLSKSVEEK